MILGVADRSELSRRWSSCCCGETPVSSRSVSEDPRREGENLLESFRRDDCFLTLVPVQSLLTLSRGETLELRELMPVPTVDSDARRRPPRQASPVAA